MNDPDPNALTGDWRDDPPETRQAGSAIPQLPDMIGRYRIEKLLGRGGFGCVFLAYDDQLERKVAIKVPHAEMVAQVDDADLYLAEARTVASLDHPNIVPVYDVGSTAEFPCYIVCKYIEGSNLAERLGSSRLNYVEATELAATVAEALHYAHIQGVVHRDVKPGNILLDVRGKPYVADFGLALKDVDFGKSPGFAGTPNYMSPEQARGEGHRVDGRSDIFSLAVVLYELLVSRKPFRGDSRSQLLQEIAKVNPRPPRQIDDAIPKELERICLKALSKRASERYTTAKDMAEDLRHVLSEQLLVENTTAPASAASSNQDTLIATPPATSAATPPPASSIGSFDSQPLRIVPKGLRSFDAHDADFFLELLPGARDRDGLPESIRFWKTRIEETDADKTFSIGLIYGPPGCGKSSLVKAGLLSRLSEDVIAVYIEAAADETESRLLAGLRKCCDGLPNHLNLIETLAALRRRHGLPAGKKVLIVLDQFEQWLNAKREDTESELVQALRQCDGGNVQCVVMVRDDFWLAVSRFMRDLEVHLLEGQNSALVDLFDVDHARKVLAAFGRAFGRLPENPAETTDEQKRFLKQAVGGLAEDGKLICVRLALFAEMMKGKPWTPAILEEVGGTEGVGVTFLEETFSVSTAPPQHRLHQKAARAVLKTLLPESGANIKGRMRSYQQLLDASGYANRRRDFDDLIRILDSEIRLITPTDPEGMVGDDVEPSLETRPGEQYYQLTHDYLVPSLREWLTRKQKETRRGRAELRLAERAAAWNAKPENWHLPALWEYVNVRWFTKLKDRTPRQQKMMRKAARFHLLRVSVAAAALVIVAVGAVAIRGRIVEGQNESYAKSLVERLLDAKIEQAPGIVRLLAGYRQWTDEDLKKVLREVAADGNEKLSSRRLRASLGLLPVDPRQADYLYAQALGADPEEVPVLRKMLLEYKAQRCERLWSVWDELDDGGRSQTKGRGGFH